MKLSFLILSLLIVLTISVEMAKRNSAKRKDFNKSNVSRNMKQTRMAAKENLTAAQQAERAQNMKALKQWRKNLDNAKFRAAKAAKKAPVVPAPKGTAAKAPAAKAPAAKAPAAAKKESTNAVAKKEAAIPAKAGAPVRAAKKAQNKVQEQAQKAAEAHKQAVQEEKTGAKPAAPSKTLTLAERQKNHAAKAKNMNFKEESVFQKVQHKPTNKERYENHLDSTYGEPFRFKTRFDTSSAMKEHLKEKNKMTAEEMAKQPSIMSLTKKDLTKTKFMPNPYMGFTPVQRGEIWQGNRFRFAQTETEKKVTKTVSAEKKKALAAAAAKQKLVMENRAKLQKAKTIANAKIIAKASVNNPQEKAEKKKEILQWAKNIKNAQMVNQKMVQIFSKNPLMVKMGQKNNDKKDFTNLSDKYVLEQRILKAQDMEHKADVKLEKQLREQKKYGPKKPKISQVSKAIKSQKASKKQDKIVKDVKNDEEYNNFSFLQVEKRHNPIHDVSRGQTIQQMYALKANDKYGHVKSARLAKKEGPLSEKQYAKIREDVLAKDKEIHTEKLAKSLKQWRKDTDMKKAQAAAKTKKTENTEKLLMRAAKVVKQSQEKANRRRQ